MFSLLCGTVTVLWCALLSIHFTASVSPDGHVYRQIARGKGGPLPFRLRPLLPRILGTESRRWEMSNLLAFFLAGFLFPSVLPTLSHSQLLFSIALFLGLPGLIHTSISMPVLVDPWALVSALSVVALLNHGAIAAAIAVACVGALVKETVPVWAAVWALSPWPLLGLLVVGAAWRLTKSGPHPLGLSILPHLSIKTRTGAVLRPDLLLWPWGVALLGFQPTPAVLLALAVGYGSSLLLATDSSRVYQWAFLPVVAAAATLLPTELLLPLAALHLLSPWAKVS